MAVTRQDYTQAGSTTTYVVPFVVIEPTDIDVYVNAVLQLQQNTTSTADATHPQVISGDITQGTALTNYTVAINNGTFTFNAALTAGDYIVVERTTDDTSAATFVSGSTIRAKDLNDSFDQIRFLAEEAVNTANRNVIESRERDNSYTAQGYKIENLADADSDDDAVNRAQLGKVITDDLLEGEAIDLTDVTGGTNSNKQVTISVEDSSKTNKGAVTINEGEGIDVVYTNGDAVISGEDSSKTNKGVVTINEAHAIGVTYTNGDAVISADKGTANQQGVVRIQEQDNGTNGNPVNVDYTTDGEVEIGITDNTIDVAKLKTADIVQTSAYASTWANEDDKIATVGAIAKRHDLTISTSAPTTTQLGRLWYNNTISVNSLNMWDGSGWKVVTSGTPYIPQGTTIVRYVDVVNGSDASDVTGFLPQAPLQSIERALELVNASVSGDGTLIVIAPGVYQETLPLRIEKNNVSIVGTSLRSCFVHPTVATETNSMFEVTSGSYITNLTLLGLKVPTADQGSRNNSLDNDATYGLPSNQPFAVRFRTDIQPIILKSPYIQNCTHFSDAHFDNANFDPNTFQSTDAQTYSAVAGDQTSAPCGGGLLIDGAAVSSSSPIRSMVVDAFTQICLDGPGVLVTNNGYAQLVSFFGTFTHYHAKAKNGGQINLSNCVSDFGRYGLIADGKSPAAIASATISSPSVGAGSGSTTVTIGALSQGTFHGSVSQPLNHMMITIDGVDYGVVSSVANGSGWDVTLTSGLTGNITSTSAAFALRSYISTGGHTFEFVGVGTNYSDHPDEGGVPIEANQVIELNGGKVWQSSTDHVGKFKAGNVLVVDQVSETVDLKDTTVTGNITVTGTVDGRDVATDGTKLDGIATGATNYANSDVDAHLNQSTAGSNEVLSWNGSDYDWVPQSGGGGGGAVDSVNTQTGVVVLDADDIDDSSTTHKFTTAAEATKLAGIATGAIANVVEDTAPQLGGPLDVQAQEINTSTTNGNIKLTPDGTGVVEIKGNTGNDAAIQLNCDQNSYGVKIKSPSHSAGASYTLTLPDDTGTPNQLLTTDGAGNLSWSSSGGITDSSGSSTSLGIGSSTALDAETTTGGHNIAIGENALTDLTSGFGNIAIGKDAFSSMVTSNIGSYGSVAIGNSAGKNFDSTLGGIFGCVYIGYGAGLLSGTIAGVGQETHVGSFAGYYNSGSRNSSFGYRALSGMGSGSPGSTGHNASSNTAIGAYSLLSNTLATNCTAVGADALEANTTGSQNTAVGAESLEANTVGIQNTAVGVNSGTLSQGNKNTFLGYNAGAQLVGDIILDTGKNNIIIGYEAQASTTTVDNEITLGDANITKFRVPGINFTVQAAASTSLGIGTSALDSETFGSSNTALGYQAAAAVETGSQNTVLGRSALRLCETGSNNTAIGFQALDATVSGSNNTAVGRDAGSLSTSNFNTFVGYGSGNTTTTGQNNLLLGYDAEASAADTSNEITLGNTSITKFRVPGINFILKDNASLPSTGQILTADSSGEGYWADGVSDTSSASTSFGLGTGSFNADTSNSNSSAFGINALKTATVGGKNTAIGTSALETYNGTSGQGSNTAVGYRGLYLLETGQSNVAVGEEALRSVTDNSNSTAIGARSGFSATGSQCTYLGSNASAFVALTGSNLTLIGYNSSASSTTVSNEITLGNTAISTLRCNTQSITGLSDGRDKTEVEDIPIGLDFVDNLRPVKFKWETRDGNGKDGTYEAGFIAQDLQLSQSTSNADYMGLVMDENPERLEASYGKLIPVLVKAIQELKAEVELLKANT